MAGYSEKSLADKLGIKPGFKVAIIKAPSGYDRLIKEWPVGVSISRSLGGKYDFIHYFTKGRSVLEAVFQNLSQHIEKNGALWISWPKQSSGVKTDLNDNVVREIGLAAGLVDVKVAAIDETWSGIKFVYRLKDR
ncbi:MAG TPA: DUF3052 domain-containing protein [Candidatus Nanoarchaeia archaeon]|nr:DUF3052 domain-containing protein [Candidatus Nanoarchaeia archaeon]